MKYYVLKLIKPVLLRSVCARVLRMSVFAGTCKWASVHVLLDCVAHGLDMCAVIAFRTI